MLVELHFDPSMYLVTPGEHSVLVYRFRDDVGEDAININITANTHSNKNIAQEVDDDNDKKAVNTDNNSNGGENCDDLVSGNELKSSSSLSSRFCSKKPQSPVECSNSVDNGVCEDNDKMKKQESVKTLNTISEKHHLTTGTTTTTTTSPTKTKTKTNTNTSERSTRLDVLQVLQSLLQEGMVLWKWQFNSGSQCCIEASFININLL